MICTYDVSNCYQFDDSRTITPRTKPPDKTPGQNPRTKPPGQKPPDKTPRTKPWTNAPLDKTPRWTKPPQTKTPIRTKLHYKTPLTQTTTAKPPRINPRSQTKHSEDKNLAKSKMAFILNSDGFRALLLMM